MIATEQLNSLHLLEISGASIASGLNDTLSSSEVSVEQVATFDFGSYLSFRQAIRLRFC